ncbi:MAG: WYL domain-containing protein [Christensenellaceae bacterium]|nr:WYL domain-containing protein [Christensenellaceae bacterium]
MIFSELYSAYYNTVAKILKAAVDHTLQKNELRLIIENTAFGESILNIAPALDEERWQLVHADGTTPIGNDPSMPLTILQKRWLKAISLDPRLRLFTDEFPELSDVEPLFSQEDYFVFDRYTDGDPYEDETYIKHFRLILDAIRNRYPLSIDTTNRRGNITHLVLLPEYLEYSEKDDKFRLISSGNRYGSTTNLGRIVSCKPYDKPYDIYRDRSYQSKPRTLEFELIDKRNALERVLLHFAHFEKEAEKLEEGRYLVRIVYDKDDETEIVIRVLSFGPMIKVTAPQNFVDLIKDRLIHQKSCGQ